MKIAVTIVLLTSWNDPVAWVTDKMAEKFPDFEIQEIKELEENSEDHNKNY